jgi:hypothetical protein
LPARNAYAFKSGHLLPAFASPLTEWRDAAPIFRGPQLRKPILPHTRPSDAENLTTAAGLKQGPQARPAGAAVRLDNNREAFR